MRNLIVKKFKIVKLIKELSRKIDTISLEKIKTQELISVDRRKINSLSSERDSLNATSGVHTSEHLLNSFNYRLKLTEDISILQTSVKKKSRDVLKLNKELMALATKKIASEKLIDRLGKKIMILETKREQQELEQINISKLYIQGD